MTEDHRLIKSAKTATDGNVSEAGEIPEDLMEAARKVIVNDLGIDILGAKLDSYAACVAEAILAEREACAKIAEEWEKPEKLLPMCSDEYNHVADVGMIEAQERISEAIRRR